MSKLLDKIKEAINHSGFRRYFANTSWVFAEKVLRIIASLFVGIYVARYLGPARFGIYSYVLAFVALFGPISKLGFDGITVRELVNHPDKRDFYLGTVFWLKAAGALLALGLIAIAVQFTTNDPKTNLYIFIIASGLIFQSFVVIDFYFQSRVLSKYVSICRLTQLIVSSLLKLYFIFIKADLFWFVLVIFIDHVTLAVTLALSYWKQKLGIFFKHFRFGLAKEMLKNSWPLIISTFLTIMLFRIDQIMIKEMLGMEAVGYYAAAVKLSEVWYFVPVIITGSLFPAILNAKKRNNQLYYSRLQKLYTLVTWLAICIALPIMFLSSWLIQLVYGAAYIQSIQVLRVLIWACPFVFLGNASGKWFLTEGIQHLLLVRTTIGVSSNVIINLFLIPKYGIIGAAVATLVSYFLAYYISYIFNQKLRILFIMTTKSFYPRTIFCRQNQ